MKNKYLISLLFIVLVLSSCIKEDFDTPPVQNPVATHTIAQFKNLYKDSTLCKINTDIILKGKVISNDEQGNFYKEIYIQDEEAGIKIGVDVSSLYKLFPPGKIVYINLNGLYVGKYATLMQIGYLYNGGIGRMNDTQMKKAFLIDNIAEQDQPIIASIDSLKQEKYVGRLVGLENVSFVEAGQTYSTSNATTNRTIKDQANKTLILRTSNYAQFALDTLPSGTGKIIGVLGKYNADYQLYIRDKNDVKF